LKLKNLGGTENWGGHRFLYILFHFVLIETLAQMHFKAAIIRYGSFDNPYRYRLSRVSSPARMICGFSQLKRVPRSRRKGKGKRSSGIVSLLLFVIRNPTSASNVACADPHLDLVSPQISPSPLLPRTLEISHN
jgi:hypothetical protein